MSRSLNLYATNVFAEHPLALWALDDTSDYVALISRENQDLSNWFVSGANIVDATTDEQFQLDRPSKEPFPGIYLNGIKEIQGNSGEIVMQNSSFPITNEQVEASSGSFAISLGVFSYDRSIDLSLEIYDGEDLLDFREIPISAQRDWALVSQTFSLPEASIFSLTIKLKFSFQEGISPYLFAINGINVGQLSEEFFLESAGVIPSLLPSEMSIYGETLFGVEALPYGLEGSAGYYVSDGKKVYAKNGGLPLVYGAFNSTIIKPLIDSPSLILPGLGFMNKSGQYQKVTFEFWAKIQNNSFAARRIFGAIASSDGLYVEGPFLKLKVGNYVGSHYVGEWDRPMLINIRYSPTKISMTINGEEVISINADVEALSFPDLLDEDGLSQDWVAFYAYEDVPTIQVDCVGIYPYEVPAIVSKRRFVFGQAVDTPRNIQGFKTSNSVFIDQSFAKNTKNYTYPGIGRWSNGVVENILPNPESLSLPEYSLPSIVFNNRTIDDWYQDIDGQNTFSELNFPYITMKPNTSWDSSDGYLLFESLSEIQEKVNGIFGIFSFRQTNNNDELLFQVINKKTGDNLSAILNNGVVSYVVKSKKTDGSLEESIIHSTSQIPNDTIFMAGIHIPRSSAHLGNKISRLFSSRQDLTVFVAGNSEFNKTFTGRIHSFGFSSKRNLSKIENEFLLTGMPVNFSENYTEIIVYDGGEASTSAWETVADGGQAEQETFDFVADANGMFLIATDALNHIGTYTLMPQNYFGAFRLDIGVDSYWEDYLPLSYFASYVLDGAANKYRDIDFIQFNIDYPIFNSYIDGKYNSLGSAVKVYATFYKLSDGAATDIESITNVSLLDQSGVVEPGQEWINTKYEIIDDTIIYPPIGEDFEKLGIRIHIDAVSSGIETQPVTIRSMKLSSRSLGYSKNRIGNKFGVDLYPYRSVGLYSDYKLVSPFSIYKNTMPYLYLSGSSGIRVRDNYATSDNRGLEVPINKNSASFFKVGAMQMMLKYGLDHFPETPVKIFDIEDKNKTINFYLVSYPSDRSRGYVFALNADSGTPEYGIIYNVNGKAVKRLTLNSNVWTSIGLSFETALDMSQSIGYLRITNPIFINNISYYQITEADEATRLAYRKWYAVRSEPDNPLDWEYWNESTWQEVLFLKETSPRIIDPATIYKQYTGTDRIVNQSGSSLIFGQYKYSAFKDIRWSRITLNSA